MSIELWKCDKNLEYISKGRFESFREGGNMEKKFFDESGN